MKSSGFHGSVFFSLAAAACSPAASLAGVAEEGGGAAKARTPIASMPNVILNFVILPPRGRILRTCSTSQRQLPSAGYRLPDPGRQHRIVELTRDGNRVG